MKNIHVLPTDKPSRLWTNNLRRRLELDEFPEQHPTNIAKHIYITNDEEIKQGYWHLVWLRDKWEVLNYMPSIGYRKECLGKEVCKIILTTDQDLIKDGVQSIDDEFLEWYVKNPSCEEVETYSLGVKNQLTGESGHYKYEIIIPSEENSIEAKQRAKNYMSLKGALEPKQESLEEAAQRLYPGVDRQVDRMLFINGAKWQQETMYSEEEVDKLISIIEWYDNESDVRPDVEIFMWFEQFKKK